jgi:hypothetical protein
MWTPDAVYNLIWTVVKGGIVLMITWWFLKD